jgi:hypothetical protein
MKYLPSILPVLAGLAFLSGCETVPKSSSAYFDYDRPAKHPKHPENVRVKVSLNNQMAYVMEGDEPLLVTPIAVGTASTPTPTGSFRIFNKESERRANTHGYFRNPSTGETRKGKLSERPSGWQFVGTPMPYWMEFAPAYGFHSGWVHPTPRTHGCLRLHENVAPEFFRIVSVGTPVTIARSLPEDNTVGQNVPRPPSPASLPDYPHELEMSPKPERLPIGVRSRRQKLIDA